MKNTIKISIFLILFNANQLIAEDLKDIPISKAKSVYLKSENENSKKVLNHIDKKEYKLFQNSLVYKINIDTNLVSILLLLLFLKPIQMDANRAPIPAVVVIKDNP